MAQKLINIDNAFLQNLWHAGIKESPQFNRALNIKIYIGQMHGAGHYLYYKSTPLFAEPTSRVSDRLRGDVFEIATKMKAMREWYELNETRWDKEIIDIDDLKRFVDEYCEKKHPDFEFVKEYVGDLPKVDNTQVIKSEPIIVKESGNLAAPFDSIVENIKSL